MAATAKVAADLYLRLSDPRTDGAETFGQREAKLRAAAAGLGWDVARVVVENDENGNGKGRAGNASAFKRRKVIVDGQAVLRVIRPGWQSVIADLRDGRAGAVLAEDLDRVARDPRDLEDLIDECEQSGAVARSLSGSLKLDTDADITTARIMVAVANKSSRDTARRVADSRERRAEKGIWGGGRRPYGYQATGEGRLAVVDEEARELRDAADAILAGGSLRARARDLRERGVPTATGDAAWTAGLLRDVLTKPAVAGIAVHNGTGHAGGWEAIIERDTWEALRAIFADPARRTMPGNTPRWLGSCLYLCGVCGDGTTVRVTGRRRNHPASSYTCQGPVQHLRRAVGPADEWVGKVICARLSKPDAADLLRPPARPGVDAGKLRRDAEGLRARLTSQAIMHADEIIDDAQLAAGTRRIREKLARIDGQLAAATAPDPLAEFRGGADAAGVWEGLSLERKRGVLGVLATVTVLPARRRGPGFDPDTVRIDWKQP